MGTGQNGMTEDVSYKYAKMIRKQKGISLQELSDKTGLSVAYLSKYENGKANITIATLKKIANELGVTIADMLTEPADSNILVVREEERYRLVHHQTEKGVSLEEFITKGKSYHMTVVVITLAVQDSTELELSHSYSEECIFVLEGELEIDYGEQKICLGVGDSVYYDARTMHRWVNAGSTPVKFLMAQYPPTF